jgi:hypothetical protein
MGIPSCRFALVQAIFHRNGLNDSMGYAPPQRLCSTTTWVKYLVRWVKSPKAHKRRRFLCFNE